MQASLYLDTKNLAWPSRGHTSTHHIFRPTPTVRFRPLPLVSAVATSPPPLTRQKIHSLPPEKVELLKSLEGWASQTILPFLKPIDECWQPSTFLPDPSLPKEEFLDRVRALRDGTDGLPDEYFVVLVGNMITEEVLPAYQSMLNGLNGVRDESGVSSSPWAQWIRAWSAEENRHGDLLKTFLYLSGRVDMFKIEKTIQNLIGAGMEPGTENNPYLGFVYASFQERATFISHGNTARLAKDCGDPVLARICGTIASDERRHEFAYSKIVEKLLEVDPTKAMVAIADMMRKKIIMPGHLMYDGEDPKLYEHFGAVTQRLGVYTTHDYANILEFFIGRWRLEKMEGLIGEGKRAQDFVCGLLVRIRRLEEWADERARKMKPHGVKFSWIYNKEVVL